jgi:hypothetical protein
VSADIPLFGINNPEVRNFRPKYTQMDPPEESTFKKNYFLLKYTQTNPPHKTTLRENYVPKCYKEILNKI